MQKRLPKPVFKSVMATIEHGANARPAVADVVASAMKDWAIAKGATHYAHVFYPLTGLTAEKHDSFLEPDGEGGASPSSPARRSSRASPTRRASRTAASAPRSRRAATPAWDVTSPAYMLENPNGTTLCIPTAFVSMDRRGARQEDAAAALAAGAEQARRSAS